VECAIKLILACPFEELPQLLDYYAIDDFRVYDKKYERELRSAQLLHARK